MNESKCTHYDPDHTGLCIECGDDLDYTTKSKPSIDWTQQPGPEYVALVLKGGVGDGRLFWVTTSDNGDYYQEDADKGVSGWSVYREGKDGHFTIHHKPTATPYQPEVGEWCEILDGIWHKAFFVGHDEDEYYVFRYGGTLVNISKLEAKLRPIKTEREQFVEKALDTYNCGKYSADMAEALFMVGFKAPE